MTLTIYRHWTADRKTYRYAGVNLLHFMKPWHSRWGWHVDHCGRLSLYLGKVRLWQDIMPLLGRRKMSFLSRWYGPFETVTG